MPAVSRSQFKMMQAIAHGAKLRNKPKGLSKSEAREFVSGQHIKGLPKKVNKEIVRRGSYK